VTDAFLFAGVLLGLSAAGALRARPVVAGAATYAIFASAFVVSSYAAPTPLATARLRMSDGHLERGRLVAATDQTFHLAQDGRLRSIPATRVLSVELTPASRRRGTSVAGLVKDLLQ
jgi:hypothetical protein